MDRGASWAAIPGVAKSRTQWSHVYCNAIAYGISVPQPGIKPRSLAVEAQSSNHWTSKEFSNLSKKTGH